MPRLLLNLILAFATLVPALSVADDCKSDADCLASSVGRYCLPGLEVCADCCEYPVKLACPSACTWSGDQCRNDAGVACAKKPATYLKGPWKKLLITLPAAAPGIAYTTDLTAHIDNPAGKAYRFMAYGKVPAWIAVSADGKVTGTPKASDLGLNTFKVMASDGSDSGDAAAFNLRVIRVRKEVHCEDGSAAEFVGREDGEVFYACPAN